MKTDLDKAAKMEELYRVTPKLLKKLLSAYRDFQDDAAQAQDSLISIRESFDSLKDPQTNFKTGPRSQNPRTIESIIYSLIDEETASENKRRASHQMVEYLDDVIESLPDPERNYAAARYREGMTHEELEETFHMSARVIDYRLTAALEKFIEK